MKHVPLACMAVGGGASGLLAQVADEAGQGARLIAVDTDVMALNECRGVDVILLGASRFEGSGAGGRPVNGVLAAQDDEGKLKRVLADLRILVLATCLGGGTGTGAAPRILALARQQGVRTMCFAILPFKFEPMPVRAQAERAIPQLEDEADALVVLNSDALCATGGNGVTCDQARQIAGRRIADGLLLFHRLLTLPGHIRLGSNGLCRLLAEGGGRCRFAAARAAGDGRVARAVSELCEFPQFGGSDALAGSRGLLLGIMGGEDLLLKEVGEVMGALRQAGYADCPTRMGTVLDPVFNGSLALVVLAFENWTTAEPGAKPGVASDLLNLPSGRRKARSESKLSFGPVGKGRFSGVAPTFFAGEDLDIPTYRRRGIVLEH